LTQQDSKQPFPENYFQRSDGSDDRLFYVEPRLLVHIDDHAITAIGGFFQQHLPQNGKILDLMSSWRSHLPDGFPADKVVGLGMNEVEMRENPQLDEWVVHDLNTDPQLPFESETFDAVVVTVSIQYMTRPVEVFSDVRRILKDDGTFYVIYSNRMFPTKAVAIWHNLNDTERARLIASYFAISGGWSQSSAWDVSPKMGFHTDPVYIVSASKLTSQAVSDK
jgi:SAM-dependent methyltransferase